MRRSRKFILIGLLTVFVLIGSIAGVALANNGDEEERQPGPRFGASLEKVCEIYEENTGVAINSEELQEAFDQARSEMMTEARESFRQRLIDEGKVTPEQLEEYDAWLKSKPDVPFPFGPGKHVGGFGGHGGGFRGWCEPLPAE
jgi:hypothetical protein